MQGARGTPGSIGCGGRTGSVLVARVPMLPLPHREDSEAMGQNRPEVWVISSAGGFQDWTKLRAGRCGPALATTTWLVCFFQGTFVPGSCGCVSVGGGDGAAFTRLLASVKGWHEPGSIHEAEGSPMPVPAVCWDHSEASLLHDVLSLASGAQKIGCFCALLHDPGWWSHSPAGTGDGYSRFLLPCSLLIRSHFLNSCPSALLFHSEGRNYLLKAGGCCWGCSHISPAALGDQSGAA